MAKGRKRRPRLPLEPRQATITGLNHAGQGVARVEEKTVFIDGALPGEEVRFTYAARRRSYDEGVAVEVLHASPQRVEPGCPHFGTCGGCSLQHMAPEAQIAAKQQVLADNLQRLGQVLPEQWLPPLTGPAWGYRRKARLGVKYVPKKGGVLVGFRERRSPFVAVLERCPVLHPSVGERLPELARVIGGLEARARIAQIEVAVDDTQTALALRNLDPLSEADQRALCGYAERSGLRLYLQPGGPETVTPLWPREIDLAYRLPEAGVALHFLPTDFTQVNQAINARMVARALALLDPQADDRVLDLFCGLGNFSLPLARRAREVVGVEGAAGLVARARENAAANGIDNCRFITADLAADLGDAPFWQGGFDQVLLDPARSGALEVLAPVAASGARRICYISCNPATLARDAGVLVNELGWRLVQAGVMDMFPHTAHVESLALFEPGP